MNAGPRTVVITGGRGFVGTHLHKELTTNWPDTTISIWDLPEVDITKPDTYVEELGQLKPDWIVHLAAIASVPFALKHPRATQEVNVEGTKNLLDSLQRAKLETKVLFISTADVYGKAADAFSGKPIPELPLAQAKPANPYAESKLAAEEFIEQNHNNRTIRVRPFPHIGPGQGLGFVTSDFASQIAAIESGKQEAVMQVGSLEAERDFTDVRDVVRAYRLLMEQGNIGEVFHVASGKATQIQTILNLLLQKSTVSIEVASDVERIRPNDVSALVGDATKLRSSTNWQPTISLQQSVSDILEYWRMQAK